MFNRGVDRKEVLIEYITSDGVFPVSEEELGVIGMAMIILYGCKAYLTFQNIVR